MSDGDNATHDRRATSGSNGDLRLSAESSRGAAPWERWQESCRHDTTRPALSVSSTPARAETPRSGNHSGGGVTVAELIARVGNPTSAQRQHVTRADTRLPTAPVPDVWEYEDITRVTHASELPDLDEIHLRRPKAGRPPSGRTAMPPTVLEPTPWVHPGRSPKTTPAPTPKPTSVRRRAVLAGRSVAALMAVCALVLTGGAWRWSTSKNNSLNRVSALDPNSKDILDPGGQYGDENFLIVGVDTRSGENSYVGAGDTDDAEGARSDTVMLVNIPASRKRVVVVSFPRDLAVTPLWCEAWNADTGTYGPIYDPNTGSYSDDWRYTETKLNSTYSLGGPKCLVKEIQKLSGLSINRFMAIDFVGFARMVDALGGVEVCSTSPLYDYELGTVLDQSGRQVIDGSTALSYVRARSVTTETNGDYGRIKRQQLFLSSLLRSLISSDTFFSPTKLNNVVDMFINNSYVDNIRTKDLVALGQSLRGVSAGHITFVTVPTGETDENGDEPPRMRDVRALFDAIIDDDPLPGEDDQSATATPATGSTGKAQPDPAAQTKNTQIQTVTTTPGGITVRVSNATGEMGLASRASNKLQQQGFNVDTPDDYPGTLTSTTVFFAPGNEQAAATVASALGDPPIQRVAGIGSMVRIVLGSNFRSVHAPAPSGSSVSVELAHGSGSTPTTLPEDLTVTNAADTTCE